MTWRKSASDNAGALMVLMFYLAIILGYLGFVAVVLFAIVKVALWIIFQW